MFLHKFCLTHIFFFIKRLVNTLRLENHDVKMQIGTKFTSLACALSLHYSSTLAAKFGEFSIEQLQQEDSSQLFFTMCVQFICKTDFSIQEVDCLISRSLKRADVKSFNAACLILNHRSDKFNDDVVWHVYDSVSSQLPRSYPSSQYSQPTILLKKIAPRVQEQSNSKLFKLYKDAAEKGVRCSKNTIFFF